MSQALMGMSQQGMRKALAIMHTCTVSAHLLVVGRLGSRVIDGAAATANSLRL